LHIIIPLRKYIFFITKTIIYCFVDN